MNEHADGRGYQVVLVQKRVSLIHRIDDGLFAGGHGQLIELKNRE